MSNHLTSLAYKADVKTLLRKSVLVLLSDKASDDGYGIWASKQTFADELCCTKQSVINSIHQFEEEGLIVKMGERPCRNGHTTEYRIVVEKLLSLPRVKRWSNQSMELTGQRELPVNGVDGRGQPRLPKPSLNRIINSKEKHARVIPEDWKPEAKPESETGKFMATWPRKFLESEIERFVAHHTSHETKSKNFNRQWATWALSPFCREALRKWNDGRSGDDRPFGDNEFANLAAKRSGSNGRARPSGTNQLL